MRAGRPHAVPFPAALAIPAAIPFTTLFPAPAAPRAVVRTRHEGENQLERHGEKRNELQTPQPHLDDVDHLERLWHARRGNPQRQPRVRRRRHRLEDGRQRLVAAHDARDRAQRVGGDVHEHDGHRARHEVWREQLAPPVVKEGARPCAVRGDGATYGLGDGLHHDADAQRLDAARD